MASHEKMLGIPRIHEESVDGRFSPGRFSSIDPAPPTLPDVAETAIEESDEDGHVREPVPQWTESLLPHREPIPWPFPTAGREANTIDWKRRLFVVVPATALVLMLVGLLFAALVVGFQDELAQIQRLIARLT